MKFNTALIFLFSGIILFLSKKNKSEFKSLYKALSYTMIFIGAFTIAEHLGLSFFSIDNIFIPDKLTTTNPGRMSPATAICSILIGVGFLGRISSNKAINKIGLYSFKFTAILSLVAIISYLLLIPLSSKTVFFKSMAIHTSGLFLLISTLQLFNNPNSSFHQILIGDYEGSKLTRKILPVIILFPIFYSFILIFGINQEFISVDFGLVAYAAIFIPLSIIYVSYIAIGLNKSEKERRKLGQELEDSNRYYLKRFKQGVDQVSLIGTLDINRNFTYVNELFCEVFKYGKDEILNQNISILRSGHHEEKFYTDIWKKVDSGEIWVDEMKNKGKDGSFHWTLTAIIPFKNDKGEIFEFMSLSQNITERKTAEESKSDYFKKLEYKNKELEQFAYVASHDLQEPLRTVNNFTELLAKRRTEYFDELGLKSLQYIQDATSRMSELIKNLLDYNRLDKDNILTQIDCNQLVKDVEKDLSMNIDDAEATLIYNNLPTLFGYETPLRLLFQNLINNAIKFRKKDIKPLIEINATLKAGEWLFSIRDNGIGISPKYKDKIFVIFQRLHNKNKYKGSGIGLAHCRKIVDLHQGQIWVDSIDDEGSTFYFTIKIKEHD
ncbi:ATP-binding protein [Cyclobacterium sp. 1_MG-2023]|uniref:sensor histidine kinase n=1 Tax=Cyclobacterium sp. 1_MG-2023 TaxID=3062681 RepID=UPI0026E3B0DF|nr:ATP-binding protein [Cyclobacterium sp. 1_MG-2023]MDO6436804.1 ATP-binding protein [Cyclobacterium sp. 1_MG-2023]